MTNKNSPYFRKLLKLVAQTYDTPNANTIAFVRVLAGLELPESERTSQGLSSDIRLIDIQAELANAREENNIPLINLLSETSVNIVPQDSINSCLQESVSSNTLPTRNIETGNCFFEAVSRELRTLNIHYTHLELRSAGMDYLREHLDQFQDFLESDYNVYAYNMGLPGTWADYVIIRATSLALNRNIIVHRPDGDIVISSELEEHPAIELYYSNSHYTQYHSELYQQLVSCFNPSQETFRVASIDSRRDLGEDFIDFDYPPNDRYSSERAENSLVFQCCLLSAQFFLLLLSGDCSLDAPVAASS